MRPPSIDYECSEQSSYFPFKSATLSRAVIFFTKHLIGTFSDIVALKFLQVTSFSVSGFFFFNSEFVVLSSTVLYTPMREQTAETGL